MASGRSKVERDSSPAVGVRGYRIRDLAKARERRREILTGAARAFAYGGYDATNMDQIAHECGLAKGHIYHYFRSKEEIFTEIRIDAVNRLIERLAAIAPLASKDPESALREAISAVIARIFEEEGRYERALPDPVSLSPENRKRIRTLGRRYEQMFANIVRTGMKKRIFVPGDPKLMTFVILRAAFTVSDWYREGGKWKPQWIVEQVTEQLVRSARQPGTRRGG
ncbi:MAG TPA: TetR/AcrR family transcriptional regulator [Candidatus Acidoferrales bacterium]|nr:TetR/AcrR family transcriptional regulator [Candidatus Acidoferrales bacterium]